MKFLIIQENGRHDLNRIYRECFCIERGLNSIGHETKVWGLGHENFNTSFTELENWCDIIFVLENYTPDWLPVRIIRDSKKLKIFWSIDSHCVLNEHMNTSKALGVNILLNSTEYYLKYFKDISDTQIWFPNAYDDTLIYPKDLPKIHNIGFCGNINNRGWWINELNEFNIKQDIFVIGDDMVNAINSYKIQFNRNISNDINYRTFETTGCKTLLITNYTEGLEKLFDIEKDIIIYDTILDLKEKVSYYLRNEDELKKISDCDYKIFILEIIILN
jgi:hypothetical protein